MARGGAVQRKNRNNLESFADCVYVCSSPCFWWQAKKCPWDVSQNLKFAESDASPQRGTPNIPDTRTQRVTQGAPAAKKTPSDKTKSAFGHFFDYCNIVHYPPSSSSSSLSWQSGHVWASLWGTILSSTWASWAPPATSSDSSWYYVCIQNLWFFLNAIYWMLQTLTIFTNLHFPVCSRHYADAHMLMFLFGNEFTLEAVALAPSLITESTQNPPSTTTPWLLLHLFSPSTMGRMRLLEFYADTLRFCSGGGGGYGMFCHERRDPKRTKWGSLWGSTVVLVLCSNIKGAFEV